MARIRRRTHDSPRVPSRLLATLVRRLRRTAVLKVVFLPIRITAKAPAHLEKWVSIHAAHVVIVSAISAHCSFQLEDIRGLFEADFEGYPWRACSGFPEGFVPAGRSELRPVVPSVDGRGEVVDPDWVFATVEDPDAAARGRKAWEKHAGEDDEDCCALQHGGGLVEGLLVIELMIWLVV